MEGQNHSLKKGNINKLPLFLVLGFCLISLLAVFVLTSPKKELNPPIPTIPYDMEYQLRKARENSFNLKLQSQRQEMQDNAQESLTPQELQAKNEVLAFERSQSSYEDDYRRYQELLPPSRLRYGKTNEENQEAVRNTHPYPKAAPKEAAADNGYAQALTASSKVNLNKSSELAFENNHPEEEHSVSDSTLNAYAKLKKQAAAQNEKLQSPKSPYCLLEGSVIQAVLLTGINSELPGQITAQVTDNILDTPTGSHLLIPKGSRLVGQYGSNARFSQKRVFLGFSRLIFPDGRSLRLNAMPGQSTDGYAGLAADADNHFFELLSGCLLMSTITASGYIHDSSYDEDSFRGAMGDALSDNLSSALSKVIERNLNISPTLKVAPGFLLSIAVTEDLYFPSPYNPNS